MVNNESYRITPDSIVCKNILFCIHYNSRPRYWLWRLDYALWEKLIIEGEKAFGYDNALDADAIRMYEFHGNNRSIEHLHPQNENNNESWPKTDVDSFGNLAIISSGFNSQQSNLPVHVKFANLEVLIGNKNLRASSSTSCI